jgi:hypothetical protein
MEACFSRWQTSPIKICDLGCRFLLERLERERIATRPNSIVIGNGPVSAQEHEGLSPCTPLPLVLEAPEGQESPAVLEGPVGDVVQDGRHTPCDARRSIFRPGLSIGAVPIRLTNRGAHEIYVPHQK